MAQFDVAVIVGSLRKGSFNRMVAGALVDRAPTSLRCRFVEIGALPLYNQDLDADPPAPWRAFRDAMRPLDAVLFVTPEYNRSIPGVLKNAIDVGSRPYGQSVWSKKPTAVVSASPSSIGAFGANHALRQSFVFLDMPAMQQPEAYIANAHKLFDEAGKLTVDSTGEFFVAYMKAFADWVDLIRRAEASGEIA